MSNGAYTLIITLACLLADGSRVQERVRFECRIRDGSTFNLNSLNSLNKKEAEEGIISLTYSHGIP